MTPIGRNFHELARSYEIKINQMYRLNEACLFSSIVLTRSGEKLSSQKPSFISIKNNFP